MMRSQLPIALGFALLFAGCQFVVPQVNVQPKDGGGADAVPFDAGLSDASILDTSVDSGGLDAVADAGDAEVDAGVEEDATVDASTGFGFPTSTFDPNDITASDTIEVSGGLCVIDTGLLQITDSTGCPNFPTNIYQGVQPGNVPFVLIGATSFDIDGTGQLRVVGDRALVFAVFGDATIAGTLDASADGTTNGPGVYPDSCLAGVGEEGQHNSDLFGGAGGGGGGGGFGEVGALGGDGGFENAFGGSGATISGNESLAPLRGGCWGGRGGDGGHGGGGGGAVQLTASQSIEVTGRIVASGGGGARGGDQKGGGGGGSGGAILLEAQDITVSETGLLLANGGGGGGGGPASFLGSEAGSGANGTKQGPERALGGEGGGYFGGNGGEGGAREDPTAGEEAQTNGGGGGGGGGVGRIRFNAFSSCTINANATFSPEASTNNPTLCN